MTPSPYRPWSHRLATLCCLASLLTVGCSKAAEKTDQTSSSASRIVSLAEVQRYMAASKPPDPPPPAPVPAPAERPEPVKPKPVAVHPATTTAKAASHSKTPPVPVLPASGKPALQATPAPTLLPASPVLALIAPPAAPAPVPAPDNPVVPALAPVPTNAVMNAALFLDESRIYSKDDRDVVPARLLTTPSNTGISSANTDVNTMEVVISKLGRVEEARLTAPPKRMTDMLLLSGAKMWKFTPAMKDGQPVRYRTMVSWETTR